PAVGHAVHDVRIDHHAAVVPAHVFPDRGLARVRVDLDQNDVRLEGVAGVDLYTTLRSRQPAAGRHFPDELRLQARLDARGKVLVAPHGRYADRDRGFLPPRSIRATRAPALRSSC